MAANNTGGTPCPQVPWTPGPWTLTRSDERAFRGWTIATRHGELVLLEDDEHDSEGNARLIAAAPAMAELLERALTRLIADTRTREVRDEIEALLARLRWRLERAP